MFLTRAKTIETVEGTYTPQVDEKWVAGWKYEELEQENLTLTASLQKLQAKGTVGQ